MGNRVIVIGSGFGGLGAAARLAARGYQVDIFEKLEPDGRRRRTGDHPEPGYDEESAGDRNQTRKGPGCRTMTTPRPPIRRT